MTVEAQSGITSSPLQRALGKSQTVEGEGLYRKTRIGEEIIRALLLFCGVVSIFTTIGIVVVLGRDSLLFFQSEAWIPTRALTIVDSAPPLVLNEALGPGETTIVTGEMELDLYRALQTERVIQMGGEMMEIQGRTDDNLGVIVRRGVEGTEAAAHEAGAEGSIMRPLQLTTVNAIEAEDGPTVLELDGGGSDLFYVGELLRLGNRAEIMRVTEIGEGTITVERGAEGTRITEHAADEPLNFQDPVSIREFVTNRQWQPQVGEFGIIPLVSATLMTSFIAMLVAIPLGLGAAIYLSEYARPKLRGVLKPVLEILAGVPTVVYGYFAIQFMTPLLQRITPEGTVGVYNMLSAGLVMGIMILPTISSMSEDALSAVPRALREASYGLGATRLETTNKVVLPAALSGVIAAFIVGISRAVGETMIVAIAAGARPNLTFNPFEAAETMTGHIARISGGDLSYDSIDYNSIFAIGMTLFIITLVLNLISNWVARRFREAY